MPLRAVIAWGVGCWVAAGVESALGGGAPGPLLMLALAAGLWAGPAAGALVGTCAGLCDALLVGHSAVPLMLTGMLCGLGASALPRWFSRQHLIVAVMAALVVTVISCCARGLATGMPVSDLCRWACERGIQNSLWMFAIYGIVLVVSLMRNNRPYYQEY